MTFAQAVNAFNTRLELGAALPEGIAVMNPFREAETRSLSQVFFDKYYSDARKRIFMFGINPGRFGAGVTGVCFTDPIKLEKVCGIPNPFAKKPELSSDFIYEMIAAYGGPERFYSSFHITAVCPLGFTRDGKNLNYYDDRQLMAQVKPFIVKSTQEQLAFGTVRELAFCIGEGENFKYLDRLNKEYGFFGEIVPLPHPRFIMQYRRKKIGEYVQVYVNALEESLKYLDK